jgi:hypothetical protein
MIRSTFVSSFCLLLLVSTLSGDNLYIGYSDYHIVTDRTFNAESYFQTMKSYGVNLQRIWILGYSIVIKRIPEQMPFRKQGLQYKLHELDPNYLLRLRRTLLEAKRNRQRVLLTLFDRWSLSKEEYFFRTPWYYKNNIERILQIPFPQFYDFSRPKLAEIQKNLVKSVIRVTSEFKPIYEVMNEAFHPDCNILALFHGQVIRWILEVDPTADIAVNLLNDCPSVFKQERVNLISFHANQWLNNGICETVEKNRRFGKHILIDTDGAISERANNQLVRRWVEEARNCGASFNHKDSIDPLDHEALSIFQEITAN